MKFVSSLCLAALCLLGACTLDDLDLTDRRCPCAPGWSCTPTNLCVPDEVVADSGSRNPFGIDAGDSDSGPSDAGAVDGGRPDAGPSMDAGRADTGPPVDAGPLDTACTTTLSEALQCFSMETFPPGFDEGEIALTTERAYRGASSIRLETADGEDPAFNQKSLSGDDYTSGTLYLRGYFFIPSGQGPFNDWVLMATQENGSPWGHVGVRLSGAYVPELYSRSVPRSISAAANDPLPTDRWVCLQLEIDIDDVAGNARFYVDGSLFTEATNVNTRPEKGFHTVIFGVFWGGAGTAAVAYVDEFAAGLSPLPCDS